MTACFIQAENWLLHLYDIGNDLLLITYSKFEKHFVLQLLGNIMFIEYLFQCTRSLSFLKYNKLKCMYLFLSHIIQPLFTKKCEKVSRFIVHDNMLA